MKTEGDQCSEIPEQLPSSTLRAGATCLGNEECYLVLNHNHYHPSEQ